MMSARTEHPSPSGTTGGSISESVKSVPADQINGDMANVRSNKPAAAPRAEPRRTYDFNEVKMRVSIKSYLDERGMEIQGGNRFNASWRGGDSFSCCFQDGTWCDHADNDKGGSVLDLCMRVEGLANIKDAATTLGDRFHLTPKSGGLSATWHEVATYNYTDANGKLLYFKVRFETEKDGKHDKMTPFYHLDANGSREKGKGDQPHVLYRLPEIVQAVKDNARIIIAEGEKDVDNLHALGLTATSSKEWKKNGARFAESFRGAAQILIIADNDTKYCGHCHGEENAVIVRDALTKVGIDARIAYVADGKDATDWIDAMRKDGLSDDAIRQKFLDLAENPPEWTWTCPQTDTADVSAFTNYKTITTTIANGKNKQIELARPINDVRADLFKRTDNWPRLIGNTLFAFNPMATNTNQRYLRITKPPALFAWIREAQSPRWKSGNGGAQDSQGVNYVTMEQLFEALRSHAKHYEGISRAPHWPMRSDQFYDYGELPPPSEGHRVFWKMIDFFCPANDTYRLLIAAFFVAPTFYKTSASTVPGEIPQPVPRPAWIIDTVDAQGSGKSTVVKMVSLLYGSTVLDVSMSQLVRAPDEILKRILSVEGRQKRVFLIDNITGTIQSDALAAWTTAATLSGRAPYGHGDETRANDFTWALTVNGAQIDTDTATRSYTIKVRQREDEYRSERLDERGQPLKWEADVSSFISGNRAQLFADILDMLDHAKPRSSESRFPDFDACVLSAVCATDEEFAACRASIEADAIGANVEASLSEDLTEAVETYLNANVQGQISDYSQIALTMLTHKVMQTILDTASGTLREKKVKDIRTLLKSGLAPRFSRKNPRLSSPNGEPHPEAITYGMHLIPDGAATAKYQLIDLVAFQGSASPRIIRTGEVKTATLL